MNSTFFKLIFFILLSTGISCQKRITPYMHIQGETMGTFYNVKYGSTINFQNEIDSILKDISNSLSTYIPGSTISEVNQADSFLHIDPFFREVFLAAKKIHQKSIGAFDPTVMPLVNAWGFGFEKIESVDSSLIDSLLHYVNFDFIWLRKDTIYKKSPHIMIDFSAIAKGYGVDVLGKFLEEKGINNYMVEIGGEVRVRGVNPDSKAWSIGIENPVENERSLKSIIRLNDIAVATSGNYRNFYYKNGKKYAHTIDPKTGYPVDHNLLSATVLSQECMIADAYATAFMVLGKEKSIELSRQDTSILIYLIYANDAGEFEEYCSDKLSKILEKTE